MQPIEAGKAFRQILSEHNHAVAWLESLITDPSGSRYFREKSPEQRQGEYEEQLERTASFLWFLGNPQDTYRSVHVAGTGGKGSVTTMIGELLQAVGFRTGVHTSPYLQVPNEKLAINGRMIAPSRMTRLIEVFRPSYQHFVEEHPDQPPRYGEAWVALTHQYFSEERVEWGVVETGMGGRYDPTNVLSPDISVITNVDLDHVPQLGTTIPEIASHKAGVIKRGIPVITAERKPDALRIIEEEAGKQEAPLYRLGSELNMTVQSSDPEGSVVDVVTPHRTFQHTRVGLPGRFQAENAALSISAVDLLAQRHGFALTPEHLDTALSHLRFPGRIERVQEQPTVILDAAHNPQKTRALADTLAELYADKQYTLVIGMLATKDAKSSLVPLLPRAERVITTQPHVMGKPAVPAHNFKRIVTSIDRTKPVHARDRVRDALYLAIKHADLDDVLVVTGSIYLLGEVRNRWFPPRQLLKEAEYGSIDTD